MESSSFFLEKQDSLVVHAMQCKHLVFYTSVELGTEPRAIDE
jgi:hypothetical protein